MEIELEEKVYDVVFHFMDSWFPNRLDGAFFIRKPGKQEKRMSHGNMGGATQKVMVAAHGIVQKDAKISCKKER